VISIDGAVDLLVDSTNPVTLSGDFEHQGVAPSSFDWTLGKLLLSGTTPQVFEVAGVNLGQTTEGFSTDVNTLFDTCPHSNFSMGAVEVAGTANVKFVNAFANTVSTGCGEALYVHTLTLQTGAQVTVDNCKVYYETLIDPDPPEMVNRIGCGELLSITPPEGVTPPPGGVDTNRALAIEPPSLQTAGPGVITAIRVDLVELQSPLPPNAPQYPAQDFSAYEFAPTCTDPGGCVRWVGPAGTFLESQDVPSRGSFQAARLQCTPYYRDWSSLGLIYVVGPDVVPSSKYDIRQFAQSCTGVESACTAVSAPLRVSTGRSGDVSAPFQSAAPPLTQPNALDVTALVNKFRNLATGVLSKPLAQMQPNLPDLNADVNALDVVAVVDAFRGFAYPFSGPCVCPSTVPCNTTACSGASACTGLYGAGATCVKTCTTGPNTGAPCNNHLHCGQCVGGANAGVPCDANGDCASNSCSTGICPTGTNPGFCRDRCGRCN
jgi:hypothetical protein